MNHEKLEGELSQFLEQSKKHDVELEILVQQQSKLSVSVVSKELDGMSSNESLTVGFRALHRGYEGVSYSQDLSVEALKESFENSVTQAKWMAHSNSFKEKGWHLPGSRESGLNPAKGKFLAPSTRDLSFDAMKALAFEAEANALAADTRVKRVTHSKVVVSKTSEMVLNSYGVNLLFEDKTYYMLLAPYAEQSASNKICYEEYFSRDAESLSAKKLVASAVGRLLPSLGATKLSSGNYPVVIDKKAMAGFIANMGSFFSAQSMMEKTSPLNNLFEKEIGTSIIQLSDDPTDKELSGYRPFDREGSMCTPTQIIENGRFVRQLTSSKYSQLSRLPSTANAHRSAQGSTQIAPWNLKLEPGVTSEANLLKLAPKLIYITELLSRHGFNEGSGDFSIPAQGFVVENGEITKPVDQFVVSGNLIGLLKSAKVLGNQLSSAADPASAPSVFVESMSIA